MKLYLAGVGRLKAGPERELFERYCGRARNASRGAGITGFEIIEVEEGRGRTAGERRRTEAAALAALMPPRAFMAVLDEQGSAVTSPAFADAIQKSRDNGVPSFVLAVGGPDGFDPGFRGMAQLTISFGAATLPHQLVRVLAAEQIYRALTILTGHPYHRS